MDAIMSVASDVSDYLDLQSVIDLGLHVHHSELGFEKIMLFSWIKQALGSSKG